jgi:hypothetical protein
MTFRLFSKLLITLIINLKSQLIVTNIKCLKLVEKLIDPTLGKNPKAYGIFTSNTGL